MGLHTWFYKDRVLYDEVRELYNKLDKAEEGEIYLDDLEQLQLGSRIDEIRALNDADYHDCFRTSKREDNGEYTLDVIYSKEECNKWLENNKEFVYYLNKDYLDNFWKEYPNGVIDFG